jgi:FtsH-binding integral membrane protein
MLRTILAFGLAAGLLAAIPMCLMVTNSEHGSAAQSYLAGYLVMLVALSLVFVGVKRHRDRAQGGVIRFAPALGMGLAISAVAGMVYVIGWEITLAVTDYAFMDSYAAAAIEAKRASGASAAEVAAVAAQMADFKAQYSNPWFRMPVTFIEIFPVGVLVSLISAALLRNSRFLPARPTPA